MWSFIQQVKPLDESDGDDGTGPGLQNTALALSGWCGAAGGQAVEAAQAGRERYWRVG